MSTRAIELDGSLGEGGGQILRSSLTLSLLTGTPFRLRNVRAGRPKPGLQPQHLMSVRAAAMIGQAQVQGDHQGSQDLTFEPGEVAAGMYHFGIGTAGATGLVLQTVYLPLALRGQEPSEVTITGGTHVKASPCYHFLDTTWRHYLSLMGLPLQLSLIQTGFYPRGGGLIEAHIDPAPGVQPLRIAVTDDRQPEVRVTGFSAVAHLPESIAERLTNQAYKRLKKARIPVELQTEHWPGGTGTGLGLVLHTPPVPTLFFGLGERGKLAERVADEAVDELLAHVEASPSAVDWHSADQILLPLALAEGASEYPVSCVSRHLLTNIEVVRRFIPREIVCTGAEGEPGVVTVC
jgi:RNA 3'-terminal phosphate cyclase (ATP)